MLVNWSESFPPPCTAALDAAAAVWRRLRRAATLDVVGKQVESRSDELGGALQVATKGEGEFDLNHGVPGSIRERLRCRQGHLAAYLIQLIYVFNGYATFLSINLVCQGAGESSAVRLDVGLLDLPVLDDEGETLATNRAEDCGEIELQVERFGQGSGCVGQHADLSTGILEELFFCRFSLNSIFEQM